MALKSKKSLKLGEFVGTNGKEDCHSVCRIFGLTGCEWKTFTGECFAYFEHISMGKDTGKSYCYSFDSNVSKGKLLFQFKLLTIKIIVRLCKVKTWIHHKQKCSAH